MEGSQRLGGCRSKKGGGGQKSQGVVGEGTEPPQEPPWVYRYLFPPLGSLLPCLCGRNWVGVSSFPYRGVSHRYSAPLDPPRAQHPWGPGRWGNGITCPVPFLPILAFPPPFFPPLVLRGHPEPQRGSGRQMRQSQSSYTPPPSPNCPPPLPRLSPRRRGRSGRREGAGLRAWTRPGLSPLSVCRVGKLASAPQIPPG